MNDSGGLAKVTTTQSKDGRCSIRVGGVRLLDLVGTGKEMVVECKGSKRDPVKADPKEVLKALDQMVTGG